MKVPTASMKTEERTPRVLVLSAGTLGPTYLMLPTAALCPRVSGCLGPAHAGIRDMLGFVCGRTRVPTRPTAGMITSTR